MNRRLRDTRLRRILICTFLSLGLAFLLSGCWDYETLENRYIVHGLAIDVVPSDQHAVRVTALGVMFPKNNESLVAEGRSIVDALRNIRDRTDKNIALSHLQIILFSEDIARRGLFPYADVFFRDAQMRSDAIFAVARGVAGDFFDEEKLAYKIDGEFVRSIILNSETVISEHTFDLQQVMFRSIENRQNVSLPYLEYEPEQKVIHYGGVALIKEGRLAAFLTSRQTVGFYMLYGVLKHCFYTVPIEKGFGDTQARTVTFRLYGPKRDVKWKTVAGRPHIEVRIKFNDEIVEINPWLPAPLKTRDIERLEAAAVADIRHLLREVLAIVQGRHRLELFHFRNLARVHWPAYDAPQWDEQFAEIPVHLNVRVHIERAGLIY